MRSISPSPPAKRWPCSDAAAVGKAPWRGCWWVWKRRSTVILPGAARRLGDAHALQHRDRRRIGFGVDGSVSQRDGDFEQVRGQFESDPFVQMVCRHIEEKTALGHELIGRLNQLIDKLLGD